MSHDNRWKIPAIILVLLLLFSMLVSALDLFPQFAAPHIRLGGDHLSIGEKETIRGGEGGKEGNREGETISGGSSVKGSGKGGRKNSVYGDGDDVELECADGGGFSALLLGRNKCLRCMVRRLPPILVFAVHGVTKSSYLRVLVGEVYEYGSWSMADESDALKYNGEMIGQKVINYLNAASISFQIIPLINLSEFIPSINNPLMLNFYRSVSIDYYADRMVFFTDEYIDEGYRVTYMNYLLDEAALRSANPIFDERYLSVPESILSPLKSLALRVVEEYGAKTPYERLKAIERYLKENYKYDMDYTPPPEGYDPVLWFLFEEKRGVCIHFNSALVLLARSIGIPARLVAGFLIKPNLKYQVVYANQFHAYAEAPFDGFGWIIFDATGVRGEGEGSEESGEANVGYIGTVTEILYLDRVGVKGSFFRVEGLVLDENGLRVSGLTTEIYLKRSKEDSFEESVLVGKGFVENGVFNVACMIPLYIDVGDYHVVARTLGNNKYRGSESDPQVKVASSTHLSAEAPEKTIAGRIFTVSGVLREVKSNIPVVNEIIAIKIGSKAYVATTDSYGCFSVNCLVEEPGNYTILISFYGTEYYLPSSVEKSIQVLGLEITPLTKNPLIRGEATHIRGWVHAGDLPGDNELVIICLDGVKIGEAITDLDGYFSLGFHIPADYTLGLSELDYFLASNRYSVSQMVRVMARTQVAALSPETVEAGKPFNITATLLDDRQQPIPMTTIYLNYSCQDKAFSLNSTTDERGVALFKVTLHTSREENITYIAYFPGSEIYLGAVYIGRLRVIPPPTAFNIVPYILLTAVLGSLLTFIFLYKLGIFRRKPSRQSEEAALSVEGIPPVAYAPRLKITISFPEIIDPFPLVWGVNEELVVRLRAEMVDGSPIAGAALRLNVDGKQNIYLKTSENGCAETRIIFGEKGVHVLKASFEGGELIGETEAKIRIVDYREEIVDLFNSFLENAVSKFQGVSKLMTPREIQAKIVSQIDVSKHVSLEDMISIFEVADYSIHPITRREYERFFLAKVNVEG